MDFDGLLPFLLAAAYFILRALSSRKQEQQQREQARDPEAPRRAEGQRHADPFEEALQQIREALGESSEEAQPEPVSSSGQRVERPLERPAERRAREQKPDDFVGVPETPPVPASSVPERQRSFASKLDRETRERPSSFDPGRPLAEQRFEEQGMIFRPSAHAARPVKKATAATAPASAPTSLRRRLREPEKAREAFVMAEVLGAPRSRRRLR